MKKIILVFLYISSLFACQENMPEIACLSCENEQVVLQPQDRRVLIEEFTGVRCINCPAGSIEIENLLSIHGEKLIAVSIHAEFFANPYSENQFDFRTDEGEFIISLLGLPEAYPSAVIDRKQFTGESDLQLVGKELWAGRIAQQLEETAKVSLIVDNNYDVGPRNLSVDISGGALEVINEEVRLTVMITENNIKDAQLTPDSSPGLDLDYSHKHVLRKVLTAYDGDNLADTMAAGDTFEKSFSFSLPEGWNAANCEVIAFAHLAGDRKDVLQAAEEHLTD
jgi:hypothetical protein